MAPKATAVSVKAKPKTVVAIEHIALAQTAYDRWDAKYALWANRVVAAAQADRELAPLKRGAARGLSKSMKFGDAPPDIFATDRRGRERKRAALVSSLVQSAGVELEASPKGAGR